MFINKKYFSSMFVKEILLLVKRNNYVLLDLKEMMFTLDLNRKLFLIILSEFQHLFLLENF